ncbi:aldo/keto reductase [Pseudomaricurvus alcaniphilus]|uniref:aldo/keto reductase n=1 Tax=Pseudomaricurvus alcaniphilus TaxID=1166482 RepID=UPI00140BB6FE|nr:aldo/keto reductase [Pseudomaricurvus alcaniphilus]NHN36654.1 aldo/keto reductase [Pseudomaricurvus alcaniphilus]
MLQRTIDTRKVPAMGLGCMNLNHAYGQAPGETDAIRLLHRAFDLGVRHFDTAALYAFGANEILLGKALGVYRQEIFLASKCGMTGVDGKRVIDNRPETLVATVERALQSLQTDHIDLYYLHRWDKQVPIEETIGVMARMVEQGKVGALGLSEVSAATLRKAHAVHPIAAVQTEYSLWTRNAEIAMLDACKDIGAAFVAFSPLARGFLTATIDDPETLEAKDIRRGMPRFQQPNFDANMTLLGPFKELAAQANCTPGQLALNWVLNQGEHIIPIPGTRSIAHLEENVQAAELDIDAAILQAAGELINQTSVTGPRYPAATQAEIDTEEFA